MPNYQNGKVYKLCTYNSDDVYYGSTCLALCQRLANHVNRWRLFKRGKKYSTPMTSFSILEKGNYYIELVETVPCSSKEELHVREKHWIKNNTCVNYYKNIVRTREEKKVYEQEWRASNKDLHRAMKNAHRKANAEKIRTRENESILCDCGRYYRRCMRSRHVKTEIHKQNINRVMFSQFLDL
jgi:hypothetical protein